MPHFSRHSAFIFALNLFFFFLVEKNINSADFSFIYVIFAIYPPTPNISFHLTNFLRLFLKKDTDVMTKTDSCETRLFHVETVFVIGLQFTVRLNEG